MQKATATLDEGERKRLYAELMETLSRDLPLMWVVMPNEIWGMSSKVRLPNKRLSFLLLTNAKDWERLP